MQLIGRIIIKNIPKNNRIQRLFINIGLLSIIMAIAIEVFLENYITLALIVPFIYLISIKRKMSNNLLKDALINFDIINDSVVMELHNSTYKDGAFCDCKYNFNKNDIYNISYNKDNQLLRLSFIGIKSIMKSGQPVSMNARKNICVELFVKIEDYIKINDFLSR